VSECTGTNQQYPGHDECMNECDVWPTGNIGEAGDQNTRVCRWDYINTTFVDPQTLASSCRAASGLSRMCGDLCHSYCNYVDGDGATCAKLVPAFNAPFGGAKCTDICPYMVDPVGTQLCDTPPLTACHCSLMNVVITEK
jgi:hypothetical protein